MVSLLRSSSSTQGVKSACIQVFYSLSLDGNIANFVSFIVSDQWIESISEVGIIPSFVRQMCAAAHRKDQEKLLVTLRLVSALSQGSPTALAPLRHSGGLEQLVDILLQYV